MRLRLGLLIVSSLQNSANNNVVFGQQILRDQQTHNNNSNKHKREEEYATNLWNHPSPEYNHRIRSLNNRQKNHPNNLRRLGSIEGGAATERVHTVSQSNVYNGQHEVAAISKEACNANNGKRYIVTCSDGTENECHDDLESQDVEIVNPMDGTDFFSICVDSEEDWDVIQNLANVYNLEEDAEREEFTIIVEEVSKNGVTREERRLGDSEEERKNTPDGILEVGAVDFWETYDKRGDGVTVCIVDSGIDPDHKRFSATTVDGPPDNENGDGYPWNDDTDGHGTHIAGIIAAEDRGKSIVGVSPNVNLFITRGT